MDLLFLYINYIQIPANNILNLPIYIQVFFKILEIIKENK